jgi:hypothetical protein
VVATKGEHDMPRGKKFTVGQITGSRERQVMKEFQRLQSHFLFMT